MGVLLNGVKVGLPYMTNNGVPVPMNALYDGVQVGRQQPKHSWTCGSNR